MKRYLILLLLGPLFFMACNQEEETRLRLRNDSLNEQITLQNQQLNEYVHGINSIQENLADIREKEGMIKMYTMGNEYLTEDTIQLLNIAIRDIYKLLLKNRHSMDQITVRMSDQAQASPANMEPLKKMIKELEAQLEAKEKDIELMAEELKKKDIEITDLTETIAGLATIVDDLSGTIDTLRLDTMEKTLTILKQKRAMQMVFYIMGTKDELIEKGVVTKVGGLLKKELKLTNTFDPRIFNRIDMYQDQAIEIPYKEATIVSVHPAGSYDLTATDQQINLKITKPDVFWNTSRYCVIVTK